MAKEKKMVEAITSMDEDFAQWYDYQTGRICDLGEYPQ